MGCGLTYLDSTHKWLLSKIGEKLTDEEVDTLLQGIEDGQGQVNYEGMNRLYKVVT